MSRLNSERGVALLIVVLIVTLLTAVILDFSFRTRLDSRLAANVRDTAIAYSLARSGYEIALSLLMDDVNSTDPSAITAGEPTDSVAINQLIRDIEKKAKEEERKSGNTPDEPLAGIDTLQEAWGRMDLLQLPLELNQSLRVEVTDLTGLVNLNAVVQRDRSGIEKLKPLVFNQLKTLVQQALETLRRDDQVETRELDGEDIAYAVADWIDSDEIRLSDGSFEDQYYNSLEDAYSSKNGPFDSVAELQLVEGIDDELYAALRDAVTVYPFEGGGAINVNTAPENVLRSISMRENDATEFPEPLSDESVARILDARNQGIAIADLRELRDLLGVDPTAVFSPKIVFGSNYFRIRALARVNESSSRLEAVVERTKAEPWVLYWRVD